MAKTQTMNNTKNTKNTKAKKVIEDEIILEDDTDDENTVAAKTTTETTAKTAETKTSDKKAQTRLNTTESIIKVIEALQTALPELTDSVIKNALNKLNDGDVVIVPRSFPSKWGGRGKKAHQQKIVGKPTRPRNSYLLYSLDKKPEVKKNVAAGEKLNKILSKMWEDLKNDTDSKELKKYNDMAAKDKTRYETEMKEWENNNPEHARKNTTASTTAKRTNAYQMFLKENEEELKKEFQNSKTLKKDRSSKWASVSDEEKRKYKQMADDHNATITTTTTTSTLSKAEQAKANDPEHFELNPKTNRYHKKKSAHKTAAAKTGTKAKQAKTTTHDDDDDDSDEEKMKAIKEDNSDSDSDSDSESEDEAPKKALEESDSESEDEAPKKSAPRKKVIAKKNMVKN